MFLLKEILMNNSKRNYVLIGLLAITLLLGGGIAIRQWYRSPQRHTHETLEEYFTCAMHPEVVRNKPGNCPVCGMRLIKKSRRSVSNQTSGKVSDDVRELAISPRERILANVSTTEVKERPFIKTVRTVGVVAFNRDLYIAEQEFLSAKRLALRNQEGTSEVVRTQAMETLRAARQKLTLLGMSSAEIQRLGRRGRADRGLYLPDARSGLWLHATIYEQDRGWVAAGDDVEIVTNAYPAKPLQGKIVAITPVVDALTRSFTARIHIKNPGDILAPAMFASTKIRRSIGTFLSIPISSVMFTGERTIVWVEIDQNRFVPRKVQLGERTKEFIVVLGGLKEGEQVVSQGGFLLDSEAKLHAKRHHHD